MKLERLTIKNFKSLADVTITPADLTVIIGPNGSGKTNLANAFAFLKEVYAKGLETAIQRSGGFENISSMKQSRSKAAIKFETSIIVTWGEFIQDAELYVNAKIYDSEEGKKSLIDPDAAVTLTHEFSIKGLSKTSNSDYHVISESFMIQLNDRVVFYAKIGNDPIPIWFDDNFIEIEPDVITSYAREIRNNRNQELLIENYPLRYLLGAFRTNMAECAIYQLLPNSSKIPGVPTPNPVLSLYGENLPSLVDYLIKKEYEIWHDILSVMKRVVPTMTDIKTNYLYNKTMGLLFYEEGIGRPWNAEEVSDGTILTLAMLCSVNDPRSTLIFIEEPENSVHPWILRQLIQNFKIASTYKDVIITTHSPTLIDMVSPSDIWCISKTDRQTHLDQLTDIATDLQSDWEEGRYKISDYLDSGLVPQAIPGGNI